MGLRIAHDGRISLGLTGLSVTGVTSTIFWEMIISPRKLEGVYEIGLEPRHDSRGFFARAYDRQTFRDNGLDREWVQENHSRSIRKGIIRGLHFQYPPFAETKLIRCIRGAVLDVFVDLRPESPTFGEWDAVELSEDNMRLVLIPRGFAHGFCTLTELSEVVYKVDNVYSPSHESGIRWDDPALGIRWPTSTPMLSERDSKQPSFHELELDRLTSDQLYHERVR